MENVRKILDEAKAAIGSDANNALAAKLGIHRQRVTDYYAGTRKPDNDICLKLANLTGKSLAQVICAVEIDAEKEETRKKEWKDYLKQIDGLAASLTMTLALLCTFIVHRPAQAATNQDLMSEKV
jgi:predicted transcriptional regulator